MHHSHKYVVAGVVAVVAVAGAVFAAPRLVDPPAPVPIQQRLLVEAVRVDTLNLAALARQQPGCQRAELADIGPGRQLLMAWFDDRAALQSWFSNGLPGQLKDSAIVSETELATLATSVPDIQGPVLATLTVSTRYQPRYHHEHAKPPFVSFTSELYRPVSAGEQHAMRAKGPAQAAAERTPIS